MNWKNNRVISAMDGTNPMLIKKLSGDNVVFGDVQFLPGYCVLLPKREVQSLNELSLDERIGFLTDMSILGDAILSSCNPLRINYDILGNTDKFLHAHVFPRYEWEDDDRKKMPVWLYEQSNWVDSETAYSPQKYDSIRNAIFDYLEKYY